jgi:hypothetical protein
MRSDALEKVSGEILQNTENAGANDASFRRVENFDQPSQTHLSQPKELEES